MSFAEPLSENISGLDDLEFMNLDGNVTLNQGTISSEERKENEDDDDDDSDSKDDSKDDSRVEIPCSAPSPEQEEKDGKDTKAVDEPNTPSSALGTLSERLREYDGPYHSKIQKLMQRFRNSWRKRWRQSMKINS